jgi:capsid portal protein
VFDGTSGQADAVNRAKSASNVNRCVIFPAFTRLTAAGVCAYNACINQLNIDGNGFVVTEFMRFIAAAGR